MGLETGVQTDTLNPAIAVAPGSSTVESASSGEQHGSADPNIDESLVRTGSASYSDDPREGAGTGRLIEEGGPLAASALSPQALPFVPADCGYESELQPGDPPGALLYNIPLHETGQQVWGNYEVPDSSGLSSLQMMGSGMIDPHLAGGSQPNWVVMMPMPYLPMYVYHPIPQPESLVHLAGAEVEPPSPQTLVQQRAPTSPTEALPGDTHAREASIEAQHHVRTSLPEDGLQPGSDSGGLPSAAPVKPALHKSSLGTKARGSRKEKKGDLEAKIPAVSEGGAGAVRPEFYEVDLPKSLSGQDSRTSLMIRNIPNKYTQEMLLNTIDKTHQGTFDFFYLPMDFRNKCNMGYAFINLVDRVHVTSFHEAFHDKKWQHFNSEKICKITYARLQNKNLIAHFQNSSLLLEKQCFRPIFFGADGKQETFPRVRAENKAQRKARKQ